MHKEGYYSSGEFAKKANVTVRTIRYYDKQNILKPTYITDYGVNNNVTGFYFETGVCKSFFKYDLRKTNNRYSPYTRRIKMEQYKQEFIEF